MDRAFHITAAGRRLAAKLLAGETLMITRIMVGTGKAADREQILALTDLIEPKAEATCTEPIVDDEHTSVSFSVEFRSDMNGGLKEDFWLNEYGIFAEDPDDGEVMIYYATLGDYPDAVTHYIPGAVDCRRYPVVITVTSGADVATAFPPSAYMTAEEVRAAIAAASNLSSAIIADFTLPVEGWELTENGAYRYILPVKGCTIQHFPLVALSVSGLEAAEDCKLMSVVETVEGGIAFCAKRVPETNIAGTIALIYSKNGEIGEGYTLPVATSTTLGGVRIQEGSGLTIDSSGNLAIDAATGQQAEDLFASVTE